MNYHFDHYDLKIYFMICIWRSNGQNYNFTLETWDGDNMQYNESCKMGCLQQYSPHLAQKHAKIF